MTKDEAIELVGGKRDYIHCFVNPRGGMLLGADWSWESFEEALDTAQEFGKAGGQAQQMKHPLFIKDKENHYNFFEKNNNDVA